MLCDDEEICLQVTSVQIYCLYLQITIILRSQDSEDGLSNDNYDVSEPADNLPKKWLWISVTKGFHIITM